MVDGASFDYCVYGKYLLPFFCVHKGYLLPSVTTIDSSMFNKMDNDNLISTEQCLRVLIRAKDIR